MLQVMRVSNDFGGLRSLNGPSFQVDGGEIVDLIGLNGSGKSTAFNVITGFLPATSGTVTFNVENIRLPAHELAQRGLARDLTITEQKWLVVARALAGELKMLLLNELMTDLLLNELMTGLNPVEIPEATACSCPAIWFI